MWIVRVALRRPYTFVVLALLILILSLVVILRTPTDIFPNVDIPVIAVAFSYTGLNPEEMEGRITTVFERLVTTVTNDVEHIESTTINGQAIVRIFFQPGANVDRATAQITAGSQTVLRFLPPGSQPPVVINCPEEGRLHDRDCPESDHLAGRRRGGHEARDRRAERPGDPRRSLVWRSSDHGSRQRPESRWPGLHHGVCTGQRRIGGVAH